MTLDERSTKGGAKEGVTDDDLKRLKEYVANNIELLTESEIEEVLAMQSALLARLAAAEKLLKHSEKFCCETSMGLFLQDDLREWRKTAGK